MSTSTDGRSNCPNSQIIIAFVTRFTRMRMSGASSIGRIRRLRCGSRAIVDDLDAGRLVRLLPEYRPVEFAMNAVYPHRHHLSAKVRTFIDLLAQHSAEHQKLINPYS